MKLFQKKMYFKKIINKIGISKFKNTWRFDTKSKALYLSLCLNIMPEQN